MAYYFSRKINAGFDEVVSRVTEALKKQGLGIRMEIDVGPPSRKSLMSILSL